MHQPLLPADKERMRLVHGEIVHALGLHLRVVNLNHPKAAIGLADMLPDLEIRRLDPAAFLRVEGVSRRSLDLLAVDGQVLDREVEIGDERRYREVASLAGTLVVGQHLIANLDLTDGPLTVIRRGLFNGGDYCTRGYRLCSTNFASDKICSYKKYSSRGS